MYVDNYCERTAPGLWGEPANALSNLAFAAASLFLLWLLHGQSTTRRAPFSVWLLPIVIGIVGLCSFAFHTFSNALTGALDSLSIVLFILIAVVVIVHWMWGIRWRWAWLAAPVYLLLSAGLNLAVFAIGGEQAVAGGYLPALAGLIGFGLAVRFTAPQAAARLGTWLLWAAGIFAISLTLRTLDDPMCQDFPLGTHFAWHCLNATVLFLISYTVIRRWQTSGR